MKTSLVFSLFLFGIGGHGSVAMAQSAGTFTATGNMTTPRSQHTATLLPDGRVLIIGARPGAALGALGAELYDPSTGTFTPTGSMAAGPGPSTLLGDGRS